MYLFESSNVAAATVALRAEWYHDRVVKIFRQAARQVGWRLGDTEHAVKSSSSVAGKVAQRLLPDGLPFQTLAHGVEDSLRFSLVSPGNDGFAADLERLVGFLRSAGMEVIAVYDLWIDGNRYKDFHLYFWYCEGPGRRLVVVEALAFTPLAWELHNWSWPLYDELRRPGTLAVRRAMIAAETTDAYQKCLRLLGMDGLWESLGAKPIALTASRVDPFLDVEQALSQQHTSLAILEMMSMDPGDHTLLFGFGAMPPPPLSVPQAAWLAEHLMEEFGKAISAVNYAFRLEVDCPAGGDLPRELIKNGLLRYLSRDRLLSLTRDEVSVMAGFVRFGVAERLHEALIVAESLGMNAEAFGDGQAGVLPSSWWPPSVPSLVTILRRGPTVAEIIRRSINARYHRMYRLADGDEHLRQLLIGSGIEERWALWTWPYQPLSPAQRGGVIDIMAVLGPTMDEHNRQRQLS